MDGQTRRDGPHGTAWLPEGQPVYLRVTNGDLRYRGIGMTGLKTAIRACVSLVALAVLAACSSPTNELTDPPEALGNFSLGYNVIIADNAQQVPPSRSATPEEWEALIEAKVQERLGRYEGEKLYHLGISVDGYSIAIPGIPVVLAPKSAMIISVNVWDDATQIKLTEEPKQLTVLESLSGESVIGTGLTKSREEQMENMAFNAARAIERFLLTNAEAWFEATEAVAEDVAEDVEIAEETMP